MLDPVVTHSIKQAVSEFDQDDALARRLEAWLNAKSESELPPADESEFLENVLRSIQLGASDED